MGDNYYTESSDQITDAFDQLILRATKAGIPPAKIDAIRELRHAADGTFRHLYKLARRLAE